MAVDDRETSTYRLTLFGAPALECNSRSQHVSRRKARALLAYLAVTQQTHTREALVAVLWPEYGEREGRADLSRMLSTLRNALGGDSFVADRDSVALNDEADLWVDVVHFRRLVAVCREMEGMALADDALHKLANAAGLYRDDFMAGFTLPDCPAFDEWQRRQSEALRRDLGRVLRRLAQAHEARDEYAQAINYARRRVSLDPLREPAQRRLMALLARNGQRAAALRQYEACRRALVQELGIEPHPDTQALYEQIRAGNAPAATAPDRAPTPEGGPLGGDELPFSWPDTDPEPEQPFVGREQALARLGDYLDEALAGNGRVVFVTGDAGRGKTTLLEEFARRAQEAHAGLVVSSGSCNAVAGAGDPYLPFREVMSLLAGEAAARHTVGRLRREQARRLWAIMPQTAQAIVNAGPQLLDVFVSGRQLLANATEAAPAGAGWLVALREEVAARQRAAGDRQQAALAGQYTNVLHHLARERPLLLTLDDLHWIDEASIALLFHLGRRLSGARILVVGAYRPDELAPRPDGEPHPLRQVLDEFRRRDGDVFIDLAAADQSGGRAFIDGLLDSERNRLDEGFRQALFRRTGGHPLFTVELLRDMQGRGSLVRDEGGRWRAGPELDWEAIPARVEAVIARRIARLEDIEREILTVAGVEGERFTAEVVARVLELEERSLLRTLSQQLEKQHRLVREWGEIEVGDRYLSPHRFHHVLFQQYLYRQLPPGRRRRLHGDVAEALETVYAGDLDQVTAALAHHYTVAADWDKAVTYRRRAGDLAHRKGSLPDAVRHYRSALAHWPERDPAGRAAVLRRLGECLWMVGQHQEALEALEESQQLSRAAGDEEGVAAALRLCGRVHWEMGQPDSAGRYYEQALALLEGGPENEELAWALAGMANYHMHGSDYRASIVLGERALAIARRLGAGELVVQCLCDLGSALSGLGDWGGLAMERESLNRALQMNRPHDAGRAYLYLAESLIYLGRYGEARELLEEAVAYARRLHLPYLVEGARRQLAEVDWLTGRWPAALDYLQARVAARGEEKEPDLAHLYASMALSAVYNDLGQPERAHKLLTETAPASFASLDPSVAFLGQLARALMMLGRPAEAASAVAKILEWTDEAPYLYPNIDMALLFICRAPLAYGRPSLSGDAHQARQQLQRLDRQFGTAVTAACRLEGQGWLLLGQDEANQAASHFEQALARWQQLGRSHDQVRALNGLSQARKRAGDDHAARAVAQQALTLANNLADQLQDPALKASYRETATAPLPPPDPSR